MIANAARAAVYGLLLVSLSACQTPTAMKMATLQTTDAENIAALKSALAAAMGKARVEIMEVDLTTATTVSVLPPKPGPFETHSLATPTLFDLISDGDTCLIVQRDTVAQFAAPGLKCRPL